MKKELSRDEINNRKAVLLEILGTDIGAKMIYAIYDCVIKNPISLESLVNILNIIGRLKTYHLTPDGKIILKLIELFPHTKNSKISCSFKDEDIERVNDFIDDFLKESD